jgi:DNA-binding NtrC family response regulator
VERSSAPVESSGGTKTILAVDDDPVILKLVCEALRDGGYDMLTSENGPAAVELSRTHMGVIHLLLSDFQMPEMSGIQLATEMTTSRPNLKVLLMSGFTEGMLVLNEGWHFLAKPFIPSQLRALVTGLLYPDKSRFRK